MLLCLSTHRSRATETHERGVALLIVIFMIVIASALLVSLAESTYVSMRLNNAAERRVRAEYILKSAINFGAALIGADTTPHDDPLQDAWMAFNSGNEIPAEFLGMTEPNVRVSLQIQSQAGKFGILSVGGLNSPNQAQMQILQRLFAALGFDNPPPPIFGRQPQNSVPNFSSFQMVANLVDYLDQANKSFTPADIPNGTLPTDFQGMESNLPNDQEFRNEGTIDSLEKELAAIPGFTAKRVQEMLPYITKSKVLQVNINAAADKVIQALSSSITPAEVNTIITTRTSTPFTAGNLQSQLTSLISANAAADLTSRVSAAGTVFDLIAKVEFGSASTFMATAEVRKAGGAGNKPSVSKLHIY